MMRLLPAVFAALFLTTLLAAQSESEREFASEFGKLYEYKDNKGIDRLLQKKPTYAGAAITMFQSLRVEIWGGKADLEPKAQMLKEAWGRVFENSPTLEEVERWVSAQDPGSYERYTKFVDNQWKAWAFYQEEGNKTPPTRDQIEKARDALIQVAQQFQSTGHKLSEAEAWGFVAICSSRIPDRKLQDRLDTVSALERFVALREAWAHTKDTFFAQNKNFLEAEKEAIELDKKEQAARKDAGYSADAKGIDTYVKPDVPEDKQTLVFEAMKRYDEDLAYCQLAGPLPQYWNYVAFGKDTTEQKLNWFRRLDLVLLKEGATKFAVTTVPTDPARKQEVEVGNKGEPSTFYLDSDKKVPYAMFLWTGSDQERIGECNVNMSPSTENTSVYYSSASSWKATVGGETLTFYDDNASGLPMDPDPFDGQFPMYTLGEEKTETPLLDSMRVGKGDRVPFSEFVKVGDEWWYITRGKDNQLGARPLNPAFFKTGKLKLDWKGGKQTAPAQLVVQGRGDFQSAVFDLAGRKEVEVPIGEYTIILGQFVSGKGARMQNAMLVPGPKTERVKVEEGKVATLVMGAPFVIDFERGGSEKEVRIDATRIVVREAAGCTIGRLHNCVVVPDVLVAKDASGKGAKKLGKFTKYTDAELLNKTAGKYVNLSLQAACFPLPASSRDGDMVLVEKLPGEGMKVGLEMKKHPLFGKLGSEWK